MVKNHHMSVKRKIGQVILYVVLTLIALYTLFPVAFLVINSFKPQADIVGSPLSLPKTWNFSYIVNAAEQINFFQALGITFLVTVISVALLVIVSSLAAWVMVRVTGVKTQPEMPKK